MNVKDFKEITYQKEDSGIVTVTLNMPKRKNALSKYTTFELYWAVDAFEKDETAGVMILTGAKDPDSTDPKTEAFCSGGFFSPSALAAVGEDIRGQIDASDIAEAKLTLKMWQCSKPVIAAVNGLFIGGGFTMCLACCDLVYCSEHAWAQLPFARLGIIPEIASSYLLPRLIGLQRAKEIMFFGDRIPAAKLLEMGLINDVLPHEKLMPFVRETALKLIPPQGAGYAIRMIKKTLHKPLLESVRAALSLENLGLNETFKMSDFAEAQAARKEKRPAVFRGK